MKEWYFKELLKTKENLVGVKTENLFSKLYLDKRKYDFGSIKEWVLPTFEIWGGHKAKFKL